MIIINILRQRKKVYDRLFLARNSTYGAILSVKKILTDIKDTKLLVFENRTVEKDIFMDQQNANLTQCTHLFEESLRKIVRDVKMVLTTVHTIHGNAVKENTTGISSSKNSSTASGTSISASVQIS